MSKTSDPTVALSLTVKDAGEALAFYREAFGAKELFRLPMPDGSIAHSEFMIGSTSIMMSGESPDWNAYAFEDGQTAPCLFVINVDNCEEAFEKAVEAGGEVVDEPAEQPWGFKTGIVKDPFGYRWNVRELVEVLSPEEMKKRLKQMAD